MNYKPVKFKIVSTNDFISQIAKWQTAGEKVVFSNGCFDLIHMGHTDYLEKARMLGDRLVIGLNSDTSVSALKGSKRPVQDEHSRLHILASLGCVDLVTIFQENTPFRLIEASKPDILVKGDDYSVDSIVGADIVIANGGAVETVPLVKGYSTSAIINRIKN